MGDMSDPLISLVYSEVVNFLKNCSSVMLGVGLVLLTLRITFRGVSHLLYFISRGHIDAIGFVEEKKFSYMQKKNKVRMADSNRRALQKKRGLAKELAKEKKWKSAFMADRFGIPDKFEIERELKYKKNILNNIFAKNNEDVILRDRSFKKKNFDQSLFRSSEDQCHSVRNNFSNNRKKSSF